MPTSMRTQKEAIHLQAAFQRMDWSSMRHIRQCLNLHAQSWLRVVVVPHDIKHSMMSSTNPPEITITAFSGETPWTTRPLCIPRSKRERWF